MCCFPNKEDAHKDTIKQARNLADYVSSKIGIPVIDNTRKERN